MAPAAVTVREAQRHPSQTIVKEDGGRRNRII